MSRELGRDVETSEIAKTVAVEFGHVFGSEVVEQPCDGLVSASSVVFRRSVSMRFPLPDLGRL